MKNSITKYIDMFLSGVLAGGAFTLMAILLIEMITEGNGWYDHYDYIATMFLVLLLGAIMYVSLKFIMYTQAIIKIEGADNEDENE